MPAQLQQRLQLLSQAGHQPLLTRIMRGIEKESLRISPDGKLAQTPHPPGLGAALTHDSITTDFSEALLELITSASDNVSSPLQQLDDVHRFVYSQLGDEKLWTASMPCLLAGDEHIPVARYGSSNVATMKTIYRLGLGNRYGRAMQTISGIHYNFSLPSALWPLLQQADDDQRPAQAYITDAYFGLIRNFRRLSWLLIYLYGASPAVCKSFLNGRQHQLDSLGNGTLYLPYATSLRMGDLGYQSNAQSQLAICYNSLDNYIDTLLGAITRPHADYEAIGVRNSEGYQQLSTALLQIENEFYSPIRPKRVTGSGEIPLGALKDRGVEYIEVRCIDVNPYLPLGIDEQQIRFIDCFLLYCLLQESPLCDDSDRQRIASNLKAVVNRGREPGLMLENSAGSISLQDWGSKMLQEISAVAELLDQAFDTQLYSQACQAEQAKLLDPALTPSGQIMAELQSQSFFQFAHAQSNQHDSYFRSRPLAASAQQAFVAAAEQSLQQQAEIERSDQLPFDEYLAQYYQQYQQLKP